MLEKKRLARRKVKAKTYRVESPISPSRRRTSKQFCEKINLGQNIKRWGFCQKQSESCWKNIKLWLILTIQIVGLLGFVGETNYHFVERFTFLKRLHHNLNLQPRNFMRSCHENGNAGHLHCTTLQKNQKPLSFVLDDGRTYDAKGSEEVWFSSNKSGLDKWQSATQSAFLPTESQELDQQQSF